MHLSFRTLFQPSNRRAALAWALAGVGLLGGCGGSSTGPRGPEHRLLVVGWDGAGFELIDPLVRAGRLPNLAKLMETGWQAELESTAIPISSAAWVAAMTGVGPGENGVYSFFEPTGEDYDVQLVSSRSIQAPPLWRILRSRGLTTHVWGLPLTFPPERTAAELGVTVAGMLSPFEGTYAWPPELDAKLKASGFVPDMGIWRESQAMLLSRFEEQLALKRAALGELIEKPDWDAAVVVFKSLDVLSHQQYDGRTDSLIASWLERLDEALGELVAAAGPNTNVVLLSDHGFATYPLAFNLHTWLLESQWSVARQGTASSQIPEGPLADMREAEHERRLSDLAMDQTRAFATVCEGNFGSLRLNIASREAQGAVPADEVEATLEALEQALRGFRRPDTGASIVKQIWRGSELYPGPHSSRVVPDLIFEVHPDIRVMSSQVTEVFGGNVLPDHARAGIWIAGGPGIQPRAERGNSSILQVAPTLLGLLDQPAHTTMGSQTRGATMFGLRSGDRPWPEALEPSQDQALLLIENADPYDDTAMQVVKDRLKSLGYVE